MEAAEVQDLVEVQLMSLRGVGEHQDIIKIDKTEKCTFAASQVESRNHVVRAGPQRRGTVHNPSFFHLEELSLGKGQFVWVQGAGLGKDWRTRDGREIMEHTMLWSRG